MKKTLLILGRGFRRLRAVMTVAAGDGSVDGVFIVLNPDMLTRLSV